VPAAALSGLRLAVLEEIAQAELASRQVGAPQSPVHLPAAHTTTTMTSFHRAPVGGGWHWGVVEVDLGESSS
jgi:hypothetical protein